MKNFSVLLFFFSLSFSSYSQKGKDYFLVDSINYEMLSKNDKELIDSILPLYHKAKQDTEKLILLRTLAENLINETVWPRYNHLLFNLSQELLKDPESRSEKEIKTIKKYFASALQNLGFQADAIEFNNSKALEYYEKTLIIQEEIGDKRGASVTMNNMAVIFGHQGNMSKALEYFFKSLKIQEDMQAKAEIPNTIRNIGATYLGQTDTAKAVEYYNKSIKLSEAIGDNVGLAFSLNELGKIFRKQGHLAKALEYYQSSLTISKKLEQKQGIATALQYIGMTYLQQFQKNNPGASIDKAEKDSLYEKGMNYLKQALTICEEIKDKKDLCAIFLSIGDNYFLNNDLIRALEYGKRAFDIAKKIGYVDHMRNSADLLFKIYNKQEKWHDALVMHEFFVQMRDSIFNKESQQSTFKQQAKYEYEKQQVLKDAEHRKELAIAEEGKKRQQIVSLSIGLGMLLVCIFSIFIANRLRITRRQKRIIEQQKIIVDQRNEHITDSIKYAKRIQDAILPSNEELSNHFPNHFVFFRPKDIVSGDFYWCYRIPDSQKNNVSFPISEYAGGVIFTVADCTGHGVPGAFMSMIGNTLLNKIVNEQKIIQPAEILNHLQKGIASALHQESRTQDDGMDISICLFNKEKNKIVFAGAHHSVFIVHEGAMQKIQGDPFSIGSQFSKKNVVFTQQEILIQKHSSIFFATDGFQDQSGGMNGKKFLTKGLENLLLHVSSLEVKEQQETITKVFYDWKGKYPQRDDILLVGIRT